LGNALGFELVKAEAEKSARSQNPDAIDLAMRGRALLSQWWQMQQTKENNDAVRALFERALAIDPNEADALAGDALTYATEYGWQWTNPETDYDAKIVRQADRAIALAPGNITAYWAKTSYMESTKRWNEALRTADEGLAINPNSALLHAARVTSENSLGRFEQAESDALQAMRLSPRDPEIGWWHAVLGDAEIGPGHFDAAIAEYHKDLDANNNIDLAAAYALAGKMQEAKSAVAEARRINPKVSIKWLIPRAPDIPR